MILSHKGKRYAPLYPDGSFDPPVELKRPVRIVWIRAAEAAEPWSLRHVAPPRET